MPSSKGSSQTQELNPRLLCLLRWQAGSLAHEKMYLNSILVSTYTNKSITFFSLPPRPPLFFSQLVLMLAKSQVRIARVIEGWGKESTSTAVLRLHCSSEATGYCVVSQSCLTLCDPMDCSQPVSSVHGILQARIPQWVAISSSRRSSQHRDQTLISCSSKQQEVPFERLEAVCTWSRYDGIRMSPRFQGSVYWGECCGPCAGWKSFQR